MSHFSQTSRHPWLVFLLMATVAFLASVSLTSAADKAAKTSGSVKKDAEEIPAPEDLTLEAGDGLQLALTYYASNKGKAAIPVVLLHGLKQSRNDYKDLAIALQAKEYAVIVPDLRGHGGSNRLKGDRGDETLKAASMPPAQFTAMVTQDMHALKKFLREKNNDGELNLDKLCVVGAEMGASVALNFAAADAMEQRRNPVAQPNYKLGDFVKALVLLSPEISFRGLPIRVAAVRQIPEASVLILVGQGDNKALRDAERLHAMFERDHPEPPDGDDKIDKKTLFLGRLDTSVQGTKLLDPNFNVSNIIADFLHRRLIKNEDAKNWNWRQRQVPYR